MPTVAEQLRAGREARQLTIEQLADATKIRTDHLRALEEGNFNVFPAPIYIRGTVRIYASAVKLDTAAVLAALEAEIGQTKRFSQPPPLVEQRKTILDTLTLILAKLNWKMGFAGIGIVVVVAVLGLTIWAWRHHQRNDPLKNLPPAVYHPAVSGDTLPLPKQ